MNVAPSPHPTDEALSAYGLGKLDDDTGRRVNEHLMECAACRRKVAAVSADSFLGRLRAAQAGDEPPMSCLGAAHALGTPAGDPAQAGAPPAADSLPPELAGLADYDVIRELGRGGMGVVYLARNLLMDRNEVLKVLSAQLMEKPSVAERFLREVRAVASLRHPNIVTAYTAYRVGESLVFAMEYVKGHDTAKYVTEVGPMRLDHACNFTYQASLGLQHAFEQGLVHRDIKPGNLMLSRSGDRPVIKILDFGLSKAVREQQVDFALTHTGQMVGTPDFIAPEQIRDARSADNRADIYSLGCTLYYMLSGSPPFRASSLYDLLQAHHSMDARPLNFVRAEVPVELAALVAKMMAKEPQRRFQTPGEVAEALKPFFKRGGAMGSPTEVSVVNERGVGRERSSVSPPPQPATTNERQVPDPRGPMDAAVPPMGWEIRIKLEETERLMDEIPAAHPARRTPWIWPSVAAVLMLGIFATWMVKFMAERPAKVTVPFERLVAASDPSGSATHDRKAAGGARGKDPVTLTLQQGMNDYVGASGLCYNGTLGLMPAEPYLWSDWPEPGSPDTRQQGAVAILKFDNLFGAAAGRIPPGGVIVAAKLRVVTGSKTEQSAEGNGATVHRLNKPIEFQDVRHALQKDGARGDRSQVFAPPTATIGSPTQPGAYGPGPIELDVTADVQAWASGAVNLGWAFLPLPDGRNGWGFCAPDFPDVADRPSLIVTFMPSSAVEKPPVK